MKALVFREFGSAEVLTYESVADPVPSNDQALVRMKAIGLNFADVYRRQGTYHLAGTPPWILGYEGAGEVVHAPTGSGFAPGDRVGFADSPFANAELCAVDVDRLVKLPDYISYETAAACLLQGLTAQYLCRDSYVPQPGDIAVVLAAGGGVGLLLTQMLTQKGVRVIAVASSLEKQLAAREAGAAQTIGTEGFSEAVQRMTGRGADVVYDSVGATLDDSIKCARTGGTVVFYGMAGGNPHPVDPRVLMDRSIRLVGGDLWNVLTSKAERVHRAGELFDSILTGALKIAVAKEFALKDGASAHRALESRQVSGKVLLIANGSN